MPDKDMQHVSSLGGPRVMLPTSEVERWIDELGTAPSPEHGLYGLACSINAYCGQIAPWGTPLLIFGDDPADMFYIPNRFDGLLVRWIGADSLEQLVAFAIAEADTDAWNQSIEFEIVDQNMTIMDACTSRDDRGPRIDICMRLGTYAISSRYADTPEVMAIIHRLERLR